MIYLVAVFIPPLYFFIKGRWIAGIIHSILYFFAIVLCISMVGVIVGFPLYLISAVCATWDLRKRLVEEQTTLLAKKMAEAMRQPPTQP